MRRWRYVAMGLAVAVLVVAGLGGIKWMQFSAMLAQAQQAQVPPATVAVAVVEEIPWPETLEAVGTVTALQGTTVRAEVPGKVARLLFDSGDRVRAGQPLLVQEASEETAQLRAARAAAELARLELARGRRLAAEGVLARAELDRLEAAARQTQAQADALAALVAKKTVRAPFDGELGIRQVSLGQTLAAGDPVVDIQQLEGLRVEFSVPQADAGRLRPGLPVEAVAGETAAAGEIWSVEPRADAGTRTVRAVARLQGGSGLRPGMFVRVAVRLDETRRALAIPATAVRTAPYGDSVFVVEAAEGGLVARQTFVRLGERRGDYVAVAAGLAPGARVAASGVFRLRSGQAVTVTDAHALPFQLQPTPANE